MKYQGSCHCRAVTFEVVASEEVEVEDCNCSICSKAGFLHLTTYTFNTGVAKHSFCKHCGIKPFYIPRSNPDGVDVNVRCLDTKPSQINIVKFDGQQWEQNAHTLAHKSKV